MYRVKMEVYFDIDGTNSEVFETAIDYQNRNLIEFDFLDIVFGEPMIRNLDIETSGEYELLTEDSKIFIKEEE